MLDYEKIVKIVEKGDWNEMTDLLIYAQYYDDEYGVFMRILTTHGKTKFIKHLCKNTTVKIPLFVVTYYLERGETKIVKYLNFSYFNYFELHLVFFNMIQIKQYKIVKFLCKKIDLHAQNLKMFHFILTVKPSLRTKRKLFLQKEDESNDKKIIKCLIKNGTNVHVDRNYIISFIPYAAPLRAIAWRKVLCNTRNCLIK